MKPLSPEELENLVSRTLRALPDERAPASLERNVLTAIEQRLAQPWWRRSWQNWPRPVQAAFVTISAAASTTLLVLLGSWISQNASTVAGALPDIDRLQMAFTLMQNAVASTIDWVPPLWRYATLAVIVTAYAALAGLGTAAYRAFLLQR